MSDAAAESSETLSDLGARVSPFRHIRTEIYCSTRPATTNTSDHDPHAYCPRPDTAHTPSCPLSFPSIATPIR